MEKPKLEKMKNPRFDKANDLHERVEEILKDCEEFKNTKDYPLIKNKLSEVLKLINGLRIDSIKDPT